MAKGSNKPRREGDGMPLTGDNYLLTFADGTRARIFKLGQRWHAKFPRTVKIVPAVARIKRRRKH